MIRVLGGEDALRRDLIEAREQAVIAARLAAAPPKHLDEVAEVANALATNAVRVTAVAPRPPRGVLATIFSGVRATDRYTHIRVRDAVPCEPKPRTAEDIAADVHGFGLLRIVEALSALWWTDLRRFDKTVNAVVAWPDVRLTAEEARRVRQ